MKAGGHVKGPACSLIDGVSVAGVEVDEMQWLMETEEVAQMVTLSPLRPPL